MDTLCHIVNCNRFCPYCSHNRLCERIDCDDCEQKSFLSHPKSKHWSDCNELLPINVFKSSHQQYFFDCPDCEHVFDTSLDSITIKKSFCPYCANKILCERNDCDDCEQKSFASHPKAKYWSIENNISPRNVFKCSHTKYKFNCPYCNKLYESNVDNITNNTWCSCTINKTEAKLYHYLTTTYDFEITGQQTFGWCKKQQELPFDFCIEKLKLIIELDGRQHFEQVMNWDSPAKIQKNDKYKMKLANENGYSVIRIFQVDVWNDKNDWENNLNKAIKKYNNPTNIFIGKTYDQYKK